MNKKNREERQREVEERLVGREKVVVVGGGVKVAEIVDEARQERIAYSSHTRCGLR